MAKLDIWNQALTLARARGRLSSLSELGPEQEVLDQAWPFVLRTVQSAVWWPSCKAQTRLALIAEREESWTDTQPETGYSHAFAAPDMLRPWHLADYDRFSYSYSVGLKKMQISTNSPDPILTFSVLQEDVTLWSPQQENATVNALAAMIVGPLTGKNALSRAFFEQANMALMEAQASAANDLGDEMKPAVPWLKARGYGRPDTPTRFLFPVGSLFLAN